MLWNTTSHFDVSQYETESEIEEAVQCVKGQLFGSNRIYLNAKKKIGKPGVKENIPDGYLIDLTSPKNPQLYVVEVEIVKHHPLKHIAVQILEFNLAFESDPQKVKNVLRACLEKEQEDFAKCKKYAEDNGHENIDRVLEKMVYDRPFSALVIIDEIEDRLNEVLTNKFKFSVAVITLKRYKNNTNHDFLYEFEPFLFDVEQAAGIGVGSTISATDLDTIVVPAKEEGFNEVFLGEDCWYAIRINPIMIPRIKYIAAYLTAPNQAITHYAEVASIEPWRDSGKYILNFSGKAKKIGPLPIVKQGKVKPPQASRYTTFDKLVKATNFDEVFS